MAKLFATTDPALSEREKRNMDRVRRIAGQSMVLLENDGVLPLKADGRSLAVFGSGVRRTVKGGTGSGDVNSREVVNVEQGLRDAGFTIGTTAWLDAHEKSCTEHLNAYGTHFMKMLAEKGQAAILEVLENPYHDPDVPPIAEEHMENTDKEIAIYVIARTSGEGSDRRVTPGDYELSEGEISNLETLAENYRKIVVVLNVGGVIDTKLLRAKKEIGAVLLMGQAGCAGGYALADVLTGKVTPSGHLAMTWAENYADYPSADTFGHRNGNLTDEYYHEDIYVGYRYFDSFSIKPAYPFGFGRSYTDFSIHPERVSITGNIIRVDVRVQNTGKTYTGRQSVQVYVSQPQEKIEKPYQILMGFAKTSALAPSETEQITINFPVTAMASYDEEQAAWVLESGQYFVRVGQHSRDTHIAAALCCGQAFL